MLAGETSLMLNDAPDLLIRQLPAKSHHAGPDRSVLDHPEDFAFCPMAPESMVLEITRRWIQLSGYRPVTVPIFPMTVEAGALAVIERFALLEDRRGIRQRAGQCARLSQLVGRPSRLHHMAFRSVYGHDGHHRQQPEDRPV